MLASKIILCISGQGVTFCGWGKLGVPSPVLLTLLCPGRPCFSSSDVFLFCWAVCLSISLLASVFPVSLPLFFLFLRPCLIHARMPDWGRAFVHGHTFLHSWTHFLAFMEWADDGGSRPAAWSYVPVQSSSCSLIVFYRTLVVGKDTYYTPNIIIMLYTLLKLNQKYMASLKL